MSQGVRVPLLIWRASGKCHPAAGDLGYLRLQLDRRETEGALGRPCRSADSSQPRCHIAERRRHALQSTPPGSKLARPTQPSAANVRSQEIMQACSADISASVLENPWVSPGQRIHAEKSMDFQEENLVEEEPDTRPAGRSRRRYRSPPSTSSGPDHLGRFQVVRTRLDRSHAVQCVTQIFGDRYVSCLICSSQSTGRGLLGLVRTLPSREDLLGSSASVCPLPGTAGRGLEEGLLPSSSSERLHLNRLWGHLDRFPLRRLKRKCDQQHSVSTDVLAKMRPKKTRCEIIA